MYLKVAKILIISLFLVIIFSLIIILYTFLSLGDGNNSEILLLKILPLIDEKTGHVDKESTDEFSQKIKTAIRPDVKIIIEKQPSHTSPYSNKATEMELYDDFKSRNDLVLLVTGYVSTNPENRLKLTINMLVPTMNRMGDINKPICALYEYDLEDYNIYISLSAEDIFIFTKLVEGIGLSFTHNNIDALEALDRAFIENEIKTNDWSKQNNNLSIKYYTNMAPITYFRGIAHRTLGDLKEAYDDFELASEYWKSIGSSYNFGWSIHGKADIAALEREYTEAYQLYLQSLNIFQSLESNTDPSVYALYFDLGQLEYEKANYIEAKDLFHQALYYSSIAGNHFDIALSLYKIGVVHQAQSEYYLSADLFEQAIEVLDDIDNKSNIGSIYLTLAFDSQFQNNQDKIEYYLRKAEKAYRSIDDSEGYWGLALVYYTHGLILQQQKNYQEAEELLFMSADYARQSNNIQKVLLEADSLGRISEMRGEYHQAQNNYQIAYELSDALNNFPLALYFLIRIGDLAEMQGNREVANEMYEKAFELYLKYSDLMNETSRLFSRYQGDFIESKRIHGLALEHYSKRDDKAGMAYIYSSTGLISLMQGKYEDAKIAYSKALELYEIIDDKLNIANTLDMLGMVALDRKDLAEAKSWFLQAIDYYKTNNDDKNVARCLYYIAFITHSEGDYYVAQIFHDEASRYAQEGETEIPALPELPKGIILREGPFDVVYPTLAKEVGMLLLDKGSLIAKEYAGYLLAVCMIRKIEEYTDLYQVPVSNEAFITIEEFVNQNIAAEDPLSVALFTCWMSAKYGGYLEDNYKLSYQDAFVLLDEIVNNDDPDSIIERYINIPNKENEIDWITNRLIWRTTLTEPTNRSESTLKNFAFYLP